MNIGKRLFEYIKDLPPEIRDEVKRNTGDALADKIIKVLRDRLDGAGNVDEILIALVKFEGCTKDDVKSRRFVLNKLYRMLNDGLLKKYTENGVAKKGVYQIAE
jgi:hypothetical protein